ncbi:zf-TFIIB domain-containing protein [Stieleria sp.]|uniref:TFIIB-type zinc ribbon-containing protein n=1 Tax=Stieleria sp. TaxID=2795976 RepID=UPI003567A902
MKCPRDGATLASETYEADVVVDRCPVCRGIWLDSGELKTIQETIEHDYSQQLQRINVVARAYELARQKSQPDIRCPKCQGELHPREYAYCSQILIDRCAECGGVWLDAGELVALEQFFEQAAAEEKAERETEARGKDQGLQRGFIASLWQRLS